MGRRLRAAGFSLLEMAVCVAVISILAGMMAPMALKAINQRREAATRRSLKTAFEAMFGARDRRVGNMRADFGFDPRASLPALPMMLRPPVGLPNFGSNFGTQFHWGYNGPYWQGSVGNGNPVDAWGNAIDLIMTPGGPGGAGVLAAPQSGSGQGRGG